MFCACRPYFSCSLLSVSAPRQALGTVAAVWLRRHLHQWMISPSLITSKSTICLNQHRRCFFKSILVVRTRDGHTAFFSYATSKDLCSVCFQWPLWLHFLLLWSIDSMGWILALLGLHFGSLQRLLSWRQFYFSFGSARRFATQTTNKDFICVSAVVFLTHLCFDSTACTIWACSLPPLNLTSFSFLGELSAKAYQVAPLNVDVPHTKAK